MSCAMWRIPGGGPATAQLFETEGEPRVRHGTDGVPGPGPCPPTTEPRNSMPGVEVFRGSSRAPSLEASSSCSSSGTCPCETNQLTHASTYVHGSRHLLDVPRKFPRTPRGTQWVRPRKTRAPPGKRTDSRNLNRSRRGSESGYEGSPRRAWIVASSIGEGMKRRGCGSCRQFVCACLNRAPTARLFRRIEATCSAKPSPPS